jgi:AraC-like DNA-binding protein
MELVASAAGARQVLAHLHELGIDPQDLGVGYIDPALRQSRAPRRVSARLVIDLLEAAAHRLGQPDFGVRHALWRNLRGLDAISLTWDHVGSLAEWYRLAQRYIHLENSAVRYDISDDGEQVALVHDVIAVLRPHATQASFTFLTMTARVFRELLGARWTPRRVEFTSPPPADTTLFRQFFRCRVAFSADRNALVVDRADFERPLSRHNPDLVRFFEQQLSARANATHDRLEDQVAWILMSELAGRPPSVSQVAARLGLSSRTLQRRLHAAGSSYGALLLRARQQTAAAHLGRSPRTSLARLGFELGFSDETAASRFRRLHMPARDLYDEPRPDTAAPASRTSR